MYKKTVFLVIMFLATISQIYAQQNSDSSIGYNLEMLLSTYGVGSSESTAGFGKAAEMDAYGNLLLKQSKANVNNQIAYEHFLKNDNLKTEIFFEKRQNNKFYTTLEEWQKSEKIKIKRDNGRLTREDIFHIYGK